MKKKTKVIFALAVLLFAVTCVTVVFLLKDEKQVGTLAANTAIETENLQDKEQEGKYADTEIKTTSEETTEISEKEKEKTDNKTTEASVATDKPSTTQASVQGLSSSSAATGKPNAVEAPEAEKPNVTEAPVAEKPNVTEAPAPTEKPNTTEAPAPSHVHKWKTINHPAETHQEEHLVSPAWDQDIYEYHIYCNACRTYLENMSDEELTAHCSICCSGYTGGTVKVGTKHHEAEYETVTVIDKEAWTETICETCGERK